MECTIKNKLEEHLSNIRKIATNSGLSADERNAVVSAERFAIQLLKDHDEFGHDGKRCPFATLLY